MTTCCGSCSECPLGRALHAQLSHLGQTFACRYLQRSQHGCPHMTVRQIIMPLYHIPSQWGSLWHIVHHLLRKQLWLDNHGIPEALWSLDVLSMASVLGMANPGVGSTGCIPSLANSCRRAAGFSSWANWNTGNPCCRSLLATEWSFTCGRTAVVQFAPTFLCAGNQLGFLTCMNFW